MNQSVKQLSNMILVLFLIINVFSYNSDVYQRSLDNRNNNDLLFIGLKQQPAPIAPPTTTTTEIPKQPAPIVPPAAPSAETPKLPIDPAAPKPEEINKTPVSTPAPTNPITNNQVPPKPIAPVTPVPQAANPTPITPPPVVPKANVPPTPVAPVQNPKPSIPLPNPAPVQPTPTPAPVSPSPAPAVEPPSVIPTPVAPKSEPIPAPVVKESIPTPIVKETTPAEPPKEPTPLVNDTNKENDTTPKDNNTINETASPATLEDISHQLNILDNHFNVTKNETIETLNKIKKILMTHSDLYKIQIKSDLSEQKNLLHKLQDEISSIKTKLNKDLSICSSLTSCSECTANPSCGWCSLSNKCVEGNENGPLYQSTCSVYEYNKCSKQTDCSRFKSCDKCIEDVGCAWCSNNINGLGCIDQISTDCPESNRIHLWSENNVCPRKNKLRGAPIQKEEDDDFEMESGQEEFLRKEIKKKMKRIDEIETRISELERIEKIISEESNEVIEQKEIQQKVILM